MKPLYIFDLDGTLALIEHRRHHVEGEKKDWPAFFAACVDDVPCEAVIHTMTSLSAAGNEVWIWSGRSDEVREQTMEWLRGHGCSGDQLRMRAFGDRRPDDTLKMTWYGELSDRDKSRLVAVFEDRDRMVAAWRQRGVACFQVAEGAF